MTFCYRNGFLVRLAPYCVQREAQPIASHSFFKTMKALLPFASAVLGASLAFAMAATTADAKPLSDRTETSRVEQVLYTGGECFTEIKTIRHRVNNSTITINSRGETFCK